MFLDGFPTANHTEHAAVGALRGQMELLDAAQRARGGGVAGEDHQRTALFKEPLDRLQRVPVDHVVTARAVGGAGVVGEKEIVVGRKVAREALLDATLASGRRFQTCMTG